MSNGTAVIGQGKHTPLWDIDEHNRILEELKRRGINWRGPKNMQLTGLVFCGVCGKPMHVSYSQYFSTNRTCYLRCSSKQPGHARRRYDKLLHEFGEKLVDAVTEFMRNPAVVSSAPDSVNMDDLYLQRQRLEDAYQAGVMSLQSFTERIAVLNDQISAGENYQARQDAARREQAAQLEALRELAGEVEYISDWLSEEKPQTVNRVLRQVVERIVVGDDVEITLR